MSFVKFAALPLATLAVAAVVGTAVPAQAADMAVKAPVRHLMNWSGLYAGLAVGYHDGAITQSGCVGFCPQNPRMTGAFLMAQLGYNWQFANNTVVGVFATAPLTKLRSDFSTGIVGADGHVEPRFVATLNARVGYATGNLLPYAFVGLAIANVSARYDLLGTTIEKTHTGVAAGAGIEVALDRKWSIDARYTYIHLPKLGYNFGGGASNFGENSNNVTLGVNYRF